MLNMPNSAELRGVEIQERMLEIAEAMYQLSILQLVLGIIGTIALIATVRVTNRSALAAIDAVSVQQAAQRAVLVIQDVQALVHAVRRSPGDESPARYTVDAQASFINVGPTVALIRSSKHGVLFGDRLPRRPTYEPPANLQHKPLYSGKVLDEMASLPGLLDDQLLQHHNAGNYHIWAFGSLLWEDVFGKEGRLDYCYRFERGRPRGVEDGGDAYWRPHLRRRSRGLGLWAAYLDHLGDREIELVSAAAAEWDKEHAAKFYPGSTEHIPRQIVILPDLER